MVATLDGGLDAENVAIDLERAVADSPSAFGGLMSPHTSARSPGTFHGPHSGEEPCGN